jgi:hypothetical protein
MAARPLTLFFIGTMALLLSEILLPPLVTSQLFASSAVTVLLLISTPAVFDSDGSELFDSSCFFIPPPIAVFGFCRKEQGAVEFAGESVFETSKMLGYSICLNALRPSFSFVSPFLGGCFVFLLWAFCTFVVRTALPESWS